MSTGTPLAWRTSTYSSNGESCVELAPTADLNTLPWRTSTRSSNGSMCVELAPTTDLKTFAWQTSSRSSNGENCVETAPTVPGVLVRHSKHPDDGMIAFPYPAWETFVRDALDASPGTNGIATITKAGPDTLVTSLHTSIELRFDPGEWTAFLAGAADGEFNFKDQLTTT
jgi:hypothetical protein